MSNWNKDLGISKKGWEGLTSAQRERMLSLFNKSPEQKKRTRIIGNRKGGRSQKEGQEVASLLAEKTKRRNERLIQEALKKQKDKESPTYNTSAYKGNKPTRDFVKFGWRKIIDNIKK